MNAFEAVIGLVVVIFAIMMMVLGISKILMPIGEFDIKDGWKSLGIGMLIAIPAYMYFLN